MSQWQPPQYDPRQHEQRLYGQQQPPQPPPWQQPGYGQPPQPQPPQPPAPPAGKPRRARRGGCLMLIAFVVIIFAAITLTSHGGGNSASPPATQAASSAPAQPQTVTYVVTGSAADVTYGPAGSDLSGSVPMHVTKPIGSPAYYAISAQLQGDGTVSCKIEVDGAVISQATASGGYQIADCEISQDPLSGQWQDTNANG